MLQEIEWRETCLENQVGQNRCRSWGGTSCFPTINRKTQTQQEDSTQKGDRNQSRKSKTKQEDMSQKEGWLRKCLPNRKTDTRAGIQNPDRKTWPIKKLIKKMSSQQEDCHLSRNSMNTQQEDLPRKEKKAHWEKVFPKGRLWHLQVFSGLCARAHLPHIFQAFYAMW